jgi:hypothetical protein
MLRNLLLNLNSSCWYVQYWYSSLSKWRCMAPSRAGRASTIINKKKKRGSDPRNIWLSYDTAHFPFLMAKTSHTHLYIRCLVAALQTHFLLVWFLLST